MYIADKYWNNYIGDTDDSLALTVYLADKQKEEISLAEALYRQPADFYDFVVVSGTYLYDLE